MVTDASRNHDTARILLVDDSEHDRRFFRRTLERAAEPYDLIEAAGGPEALKHLESGKFDVLVVDLNMPGMDGIQLIGEAQEYLEDTAVLILSGARDFEAAAQAVRLKVLDYILKEPREALRDTLVQRISRAVEHVRLVRENRRLEHELRLRLAHLEHVQRLLPDTLMATMDGGGRILEIHQPAHPLAGLDAGVPLKGRPISELLGRFSPELGERTHSLCCSGGALQNEYVEAPSKSGDGRLLLLNLTQVGGEVGPAGGASACCVLTLTDVTPPSIDLGEDKAHGFHGIVGTDPKIAEMCELIRRVAPLPTSVMITGPTGSGKEVVARAIHAASDRRSKPFIAVNCTALSREILESELFGHVRGAFTGAVAPRKGRFREADGGTLLLDEIGDTSESFQTKLLRTLESGEIEPVGQDRPAKVDVRILCATNRDLRELVRQGKFREDLFYRINVVHIQVPSLAERPGDLPLLVEMYRREFNRRFNKSIRLVSQDAMRVLARHDWPGNVRELRHVLEHAFVVSNGPTITRADLPPYLAGPRAAAPVRATEFESVQGAGEASPDSGVATPPGTPSGSVAGPAVIRPRARGREAEIEAIERALAEAEGNIGEAARLLDMHRTTLWRKMRQFGIEG